MKRPARRIVTDYWLGHYLEGSICSLCGNSGVVDTTGTKSPTGVAVGRLNYCVCPNGQKMRCAGVALRQAREVQVEEYTHRHKERGGRYRVLGEAILQSKRDGGGLIFSRDEPTSADFSPMVVYQSESGIWWVRAKEEFEDGRFERIRE